MSFSSLLCHNQNIINSGFHVTMVFNQAKGIDKQKNKQKLIARNLSALLQKHHLNANQLANILGIPMMTVRRLISGETEDPRISTLKIIADYFQVSIDFLILEDQEDVIIANKKIKSFLLPKITWEKLPQFNSIEGMNLTDWKEWQSLSLNESDTISKKSFVIESRPSMCPRYPKGTLFVIEPNASPTDGDIVLVNIKENNEFTLRELIIDPPNWKLTSLIEDSAAINFSSTLHEIIGVSLITMLYNTKLGK